MGLTIFLTGLGSAEVPGRIAGLPWTGDASVNLAWAFVSSSGSLAPVTFGAPGLTGTASDLTLSYLGPAPDKVGVDQANALGQWKGAPQGCKVPLSLGLTSSQTAYYSSGMPPETVWVPVNSSQLVEVSIQPGGGVGADPPVSRASSPGRRAQLATSRAYPRPRRDRAVHPVGRPRVCGDRIAGCPRGHKPRRRSIFPSMVPPPRCRRPPAKRRCRTRCLHVDTEPPGGGLAAVALQPSLQPLQ